MSTEQQKILIVDDDKELRELIAETLAGYGYASESAKNGEEMFAALERSDFALVLLDIMMGGMMIMQLVTAKLRPAPPQQEEGNGEANGQANDQANGQANGEAASGDDKPKTD